MERQIVRSERAHFLCPNMSFGLLMRLNGAYDGTRLRTVLGQMAEAHPFLRARMAWDENGGLYYDISGESRIVLTESKEEFTLTSYAARMRAPWDIFAEGLLKVSVYKAEAGFDVLLFVHHLLVDGMGLLQLAQELADGYAEGKAPCPVEERLIADVSELPKGSALGGISRLLVNRANRQWAKEGKRLTWPAYCDFAARFGEAHPLEYARYDVDEETYRSMLETCKANGFTVNDLLMAKMAVQAGAKKIIIAADIRKDLPMYRNGALGNYATALGIDCGGRGRDETARAKTIHKRVAAALGNTRRKMTVLACYFAMDPTLLDAAAAAGLGGFESKAASFVGGGMFGFSMPMSYSITNLGKIEDPNIQSAMFIPPASPAAKLTLGVVTVNGKMVGCTGRCG